MVREILHNTLPGTVDKVTPDNVDIFLDTEEAHPYFENLYKELPDLLRIRGSSKEMRTDLPLVSVALVIDRDGIPVDFKIYAGNSSEKSTMSESIRELQRKYHTDKCMVIADAGLNSTLNLEMLEKQGLGYSVAQPALNLSESDAALLLDKSKYEEIIDESGGSTGVCAYTAPFTKTCRVKEPDGSYTTHQVSCNILCNWSKKREKHDLECISKKEKRAVRAVENEEKIGPSAFGWKSLCDADVKADKLRAKKLKTSLLEKWRQRAGFACQVYKSVPGSTHGFTSAEVKGFYHQHVRIEDCFRIMKNNFRLRPAFVWNNASIEGHITLCVLAMIMLRLLQKMLQEQNTPMNTNRIIEELQNCNVVGSFSDNQWLYQRCSRIKFKRDAQFRNCEIEDPKRNEIIKAVGLSPLPSVSDKTDILKAFKLRSLHVSSILEERYSKKLKNVV